MKTRLLRGARRLLVALILVWGLLAALARLATPLLERAHAPLEDWLSRQAGMPVRFAHIRASWWGIGPRLRLEGVRLGEGLEALRLERLGIDLDHLSLLSGRPLDALRLTLEGLDLTLVRDADGGLQVKGLPPVSDHAGLPLPRHLRLRKVRLTWHDRLRDAAPLRIDPLELDLTREGDGLRLRGRLESPLGRARLAADLDGLPTAGPWSGRSYLELQGLRLAALLRAYLPADYRLQSGTLDLRLWQTWRQGHERNARGDFALHDLTLHHGDAALSLARLGGALDFQRRSRDDWRILATGVQLQLDPAGETLTLDAAWRQHPGPDGPAIDAAITRLPLPLLHRLVAFRPPPGLLPPPFDQALAGLRPRGELQTVRLQRQGERWALAARLHRVAISPWRDIPGAEGLEGGLNAAPGRLDLDLDAHDLRLDYRQLFRTPQPVKRLRGRLHWRRQGEAWTLFSPDLRLTLPEVPARLWFQLDRPAAGPLRLALRAHLDSGPVSATPTYLPTAIMSEGLVAWLDRALDKGRLQQADLLLHGPLADFPFHRRRSGTFEVIAEVRDTDLDYQPGWPPLRALGARLHFQQNSLHIAAADGRIYASRLRGVRADIASLDPPSPLRIRGRVEGPLSDELRLLRSPALAARFGAMARGLEAQGPAALDLTLRIPLADGDEDYRLDGTLGFKGNRLRLRDWDLEIDRIHGRLRFDLDSVRAKGLVGLALGAPLRVDIGPRTGGGTRIEARARWTHDQLQARFPALPLQLAEGRSDFVVDLDLPPGETPAQLTVKSDLQGMALTLPAPLGKPAKEKRPLEVALPLGRSPGPVHLRYGRRLDALFTLDGRRSELRYARGRARLPEREEHRLLARLARLDPAEWRAFGDRLGGTRTPLARQPAWRIELDARRLRLGDAGIERFKAVLRHAARSPRLEATLDAPAVKGSLRYREGSPAVLVADLERLHLPFDPDARSGPPPDPAEGPDPRDLPQVELNCRDLRLRQARLGPAHLALRPSDEGSRIADLSFAGPAGRLKAQGNWLWRKGRSHTWLNGLFQSADLGDFLAGLGYPRQVDGAKGEIRFDLDWPGGPLQAHRATLHGSVELAVKEGRISEVDPGIARVLGLLSLDALKRRLKLDFGDLLKKGYSFDTIEGHFTLDRGQAVTRDLVVDGPSGRIEIGGRLDLVQRRFDQVVQVAPKLDATLVVAGTIAGGPVGGAAAFIAQRLLSDEVDRINRFEYSLTGSWDDPQITALDSGGPLSKLLNTLGGKETRKKTEAQEEAIDERKTRPKKGLLQRLLGGGKAPPPDEDQPEAELPGR